MKAAVCRMFGKPLVIEELDLKPPQTGEVKIKLSACAICHSDIHFIEGAWGGTLPAVYGHEASGVVDQVGADVVCVEPGDHVVVTLLRSCGYCYYCAQGQPNMCETKFAIDRAGRLFDKSGSPVVQGLRTAAFAEEVVVDQSQVVKVPDSMPLDSASLLACGVITGLGAVVNTARVPAGSSVAVIGTGGVGLNSIQGAALSGAQTIIAVDLVNSKLEAARTFGATHTVNPSQTDLVDAVAALTGGRGVDFVFVTVGSGQAITDSLGILRKTGTSVVVGMPPVGVKASIEAVDFADNAQTIVGSKMGSTRLRVDVPKLVELYEQKRLKLDELITSRYSLDQINEAISSVNQAEALRNVIIF